MKHAATLLLCALLAGCATLHWEKSGASLDEFNRDSYECASGARQSWFEFRRPPFGPSGDDKAINKNLYRICMQARGYARTEQGTLVGVRD